MRHLEHPYVRFLDLEQAGSCKRFKHTVALILGEKGVLILARKNGRHGLELNHSNWIAAVIGDINRMWTTVTIIEHNSICFGGLCIRLVERLMLEFRWQINMCQTTLQNILGNT